jgi:Ca2+-binding EF-hand superfamily protein
MLVVGGAALAEEFEETFTIEEATALRESFGGLELIDRDDDGQISYEEYRNRMVKSFVELDRNRDSALDQEEIAHFVVEPHHELAGRDGDGKVTFDGFMAHATVLFVVVDANRDGSLTDQEYHAAGGKEEQR